MKRQVERGAALVEMAIIAPFLILLVMGVIDFGDAWLRSTSAQRGLRTAAVTAFDAGNSHDHDLRVLKVVLAELQNRKIEDVSSVTVFNADISSEVPAGCESGDAGVSGVEGECVVYGSNFLDDVLAGDADAKFIRGNCKASADALWCAQTRGDSAENWDVGIYVKARQNTLTGFVPGFTSYDIEKTVIATEWPR